MFYSTLRIRFYLTNCFLFKLNNWFCWTWDHWVDVVEWPFSTYFRQLRSSSLSFASFFSWWMRVVYLHVLQHSRWRGTISVHVKSESNWTRAYKQNIYSGGLRTWSLYLYVDNCSRRTIMVLWETTASVWFLVDWCRESYWVFIFGLVDFCAFDLFNYSLLVLFVPMSRPCGLLSWGALWNICVLERRPIPR